MEYRKLRQRVRVRNQRGEEGPGYAHGDVECREIPHGAACGNRQEYKICSDIPKKYGIDLSCGITRWRGRGTAKDHITRNLEVIRTTK